MANETITGKIFTLKDPTGTYDRFPRTVMEAVYGLIPYLQNQFSSLADIYMPIEGITETKPLQEFVYRLCPSSIKAKSVSLDRIYGKTLAWNQLVQNGNFANGTNSFIFPAGTCTVSNNTLSFTPTGQNQSVSQEVVALAGHTYYYRVRLKTTADANKIYLRWTSGWIINRGNIASSSYQALSGIVRNEDTRSSNYLAIIDTRDSGFDTISVTNIELIDLTLLFGAGNEPSTVAEFESMFPGYNSYSAGKLISNDAESMETVGFNLWDEEWELGYINGNGSSISSDSRIRTKNFIPVLPNTTYYWRSRSDVVWGDVMLYDADKNFIMYYADKQNNTFTTTDNTKYIKLSMSGQYGNTYNHDICINLSDPAKNGTYEPYIKSTMQLNLGSFQVRDSQGNVTTITGGLKSAGDIKDEIVGNKMVKRVGSVDLGSLSWYLTGTSYVFASYDFTNIAKYGSSLNLICSKYVTRTPIYREQLEDKRVCFDFYSKTALYVRDDSYTDAATFTTAMSGVILYYELATPIEYELVSPLVPTVKAGTTEARISPNADGLSAPMVADMTYDANANNDSASAQYALTAGRLLNSHTLWGQTFDGTQDVAGALTGVTSITMNGALSGVTNIAMSGAISGLTNINSLISISGTNVGIGTSSPSSKLEIHSASQDVLALNSTNSGSNVYQKYLLNGVIKGQFGYWAGSATTGVYMQTKAVEHTLLLLDAGGVTYDNNVMYHAGNSNLSTVDWAAKNLSAAGTLSVTGAATIGGTLTATGAAYLDSTVRIGGSSGITLTYVSANNGLNFNKGIYSDSYITSGAVNSSSDARLKDNITSVQNAMETITSLKPSEWIWNEKHHLNGQKGAGLVAQEVEKVLPFAVAKEGEFLSLNYNVFHAYEIAGLQNHEERIKALEAENAELRKRLGA